METNKMIGYAIGITFSLIVLSVLLPIGLGDLLSANWTGTGMDASIITMITVLVPICIVLGVVMLFLPKIKSSGTGS